MKAIITRFFSQSLFWLWAGLSIPAGAFAQTPLELFQAHPHWESAQTLSLSRDGERFDVSRGEAPSLAYRASADQDEVPLLSEQRFGDSIVRLEVMLPEGASAGLYLLGRYEIRLANAGNESHPELDQLGALAPGNEHDGAPPTTDAANAAGEWQAIEIRFRAPRYDDSGKKVGDALLLEVEVNDETVQRNVIVSGFSDGSIQPWEEPTGPLMIRIHEGSLALRNVHLARADYSRVTPPDESGGVTNESELVDYVALGEETFRSLGCASCHAVNQGEKSVRAGPNLYGLFQQNPRDREVQQGSGDGTFVVKADRSYLHSSIRTPDEELAIAEAGESRGQAYQPIMPAYSEQMLSEADIDAIGAYLKTLNPLADQGPQVQLVEEGGPEAYDPLIDGLQRLVDERVRLQRGPMPGVSGRALHVGQPNGINYSFDPRVLGIAKLWQGGFLDMSGELRNRGGGGLDMGFNSREIDLGSEGVLFAPLNRSGELIDFSFKESVFEDFDTVRASLYSEQDHMERLEQEDARFLGYRHDSTDPGAAPVFRYRVGKNRLEVGTEVSSDGSVTITVGGELKQAQAFHLSTEALDSIEVSKGDVEDGQWQLAKNTRLPVTLQARMRVTDNPWRPEPSDFDYQRQPLKVASSEAGLIEGYRIEDYLPPRDNYGREQLFEGLGLAVAEDGTIVVANRNSGIWRIVDGEWRLFAEGFFDSLGLVIEDKKGLDLVVGQKAELTRVRDTNGDGLADRYDTLFDGFGFHSNYHTYLHGPVKGKDGAYYFGLNLAHTDEAVYKADGLYMGSQGGYSGWAFRVTADGEATPWASGLRSAAGWARGPDDRIWITENQGEFVGTSKLFVLEKDAFYGHPSGLVDRPGMTPDSPEIAWERVQDEREPELLLMPHNLLANSPGHPAWDTTEGQFGPFQGQMLIGDQTQSNLFRVVMETLPDGTEQGAALPFVTGLASGAMRPVFLPDGSLLLGQTGRGWQAKGGHVAAMQRLVWEGEEPPLAIERVTATEKGFAVCFTRALPESIGVDELSESLALNSWTYRDAPDYGSERLGERPEAVANLRLDEPRRTLVVTLEDTEVPEVHPQQTARVYHLVFEGEAITAEHGEVPMSAFYTLHHFPSGE
ncbi:family 16 glycoside hydrolase [Marinimicrobium sp. C2-29]|uniref:family 16 glycoside hydrolase n=1 Tax=Marinimicrobium sp. C2-29 TaxID=3139825 RepID=UPI003139B268